MWKYIIILYLAVCFSLGFGCGHTAKPFHYVNNGEYAKTPIRSIKIWIDKDFGAADKVSINDAIMQWNYALNGYIRLEIVSTTFDMEPTELERIKSCDCWIFMKIKSSNPIIPDEPIKGKPTYHTLAFVNAIGGKHMWVVRDRLENKWVTGVVLHEMGHMLGAGHDNAYLMRDEFYWEDCRCVDQWTLGQVARYNGLPIRQLNHCYYGSNN